MKKIFLSGLVILLISCKKEGTPATLAKNNELKATVIFASGDTVKINALGSKLVMGCGLLSGASFLAGTDEMNRAVYLTAYTSNFSCITSPGTYMFSCEYRLNTMSQSTPIYTNTVVSDRGNITFTTVDGKHVEGYFHALCKSGNDSVFVQGTFKGYMP